MVIADGRLLRGGQYGAEMMESSMKSISRPVFDRLPVGQLDDFACRQLDRVSALSLRPPFCPPVSVDFAFLLIVSYHHSRAVCV